jgi:ketosteroid isomerase-like protein
VVLANPFGPAVRGWDQASQALEYASSRFRDGEVTAFEEVARYASADLVVIHEKEQWQAKVSGGEELSRFGLRVTSTFRREETFRREDSTWKLVHRHADPITTADPKGPLRGSVR